jgi:hypothetical protein
MKCTRKTHMEKKGSDVSESTENDVCREKRMEKKRSDASEYTFQISIWYCIGYRFLMEKY